MALKVNRSSGILMFVSFVILVCGWSIAIYNITLQPQDAFLSILGFFSVSFLFYFLLNYFFSQAWKLLLVLSFVLKIIFIPLFPTLSDDIYRFFFDGFMILEGHSPYGIIPSQLFDTGGTSLPGDILENMNSKDYYTVYPPVAQGLYALAAIPKDLMTFSILLKTILLCIEGLGIYFFIKLLFELNGNPHNVLWYVLNPLVIVEGMGNLHFEIVVVALLAPAIYYFVKQKYSVSAIWFALAVGTKLLPLILLPLIWYSLQRNQRATFFRTFFIALVLIFLPFILQPEFLTIFKSVNLYFQNFEFNASIYFLLSALGMWLSGYNLIAYIGPLLGLTSLGFIYYISKKHGVNSSGNMTKGALLIYTSFFVLATTVHPWYIIPILFFGILSGYKYPIIWSFVVVFSYVFYAPIDDTYKLLFLFLEYLILFGVMVWEIKMRLEKVQDHI